MFSSRRHCLEREKPQTEERAQVESKIDSASLTRIIGSMWLKLLNTISEESIENKEEKGVPVDHVYNKNVIELNGRTFFKGETVTYTTIKNRELSGKIKGISFDGSLILSVFGNKNICISPNRFAFLKQNNAFNKNVLTETTPSIAYIPEIFSKFSLETIEVMIEVIKNNMRILRYAGESLEQIERIEAERIEAIILQHKKVFLQHKVFPFPKRMSFKTLQDGTLSFVRKLISSSLIEMQEINQFGESASRVFTQGEKVIYTTRSKHVIYARVESITPNGSLILSNRSLILSRGTFNNSSIIIENDISLHIRRDQNFSVTAKSLHRVKHQECGLLNYVIEKHGTPSPIPEIMLATSAAVAVLFGPDQWLLEKTVTNFPIVIERVAEMLKESPNEIALPQNANNPVPVPASDFALKPVEQEAPPKAKDPPKKNKAAVKLVSSHPLDKDPKPLEKGNNKISVAKKIKAGGNTSPDGKALFVQYSPPQATLPTNLLPDFRAQDMATAMLHRPPQESAPPKISTVFDGLENAKLDPHDLSAMNKKPPSTNPSPDSLVRDNANFLLRNPPAQENTVPETLIKANKPEVPIIAPDKSLEEQRPDPHSLDVKGEPLRMVKPEVPVEPAHEDKVNTEIPNIQVLNVQAGQQITFHLPARTGIVEEVGKFSGEGYLRLFGNGFNNTYQALQNPQQTSVNFQYRIQYPGGTTSGTSTVRIMIHQ